MSAMNFAASCSVVVKPAIFLPEEMIWYCRKKKNVLASSSRKLLTADGALRKLMKV